MVVFLQCGILFLLFLSRYPRVSIIAVAHIQKGNLTQLCVCPREGHGIQQVLASNTKYYLNTQCYLRVN